MKKVCFIFLALFSILSCCIFFYSCQQLDPIKKIITDKTLDGKEKIIATINLVSPINNNIFSSNESKPTLYWNNSERITSYNVQISTDNSFNNFVIDAKNIIDVFYELPQNLSAATYFWRVRILTDINYSDFSEIWQFEVLSSTSQNPTGNQPPTVDFKIDNNSGDICTVFNFDASETVDDADDISNIWVRWDFENNGIWDTDFTLLKVVSHKFETNGLKTVLCQARDSFGAVGTKLRSVYITNPDGNQKPTTVLTVSPQSGDVSTEFEFNASGSTDIDNIFAELEVRWDFDNDGKWDTDFSKNFIVKHTFLSVGNKSVKCEVRDKLGASNSIINEINVLSSADNTTPTASFTLSSTIGIVGEKITCSALGCKDKEDDDTTLRVRWDFDGDGIWDTPYSIEKIVEYSYLTYGIKTVVLEVVDSKGASDIIKQNIYIKELIDTILPYVSITYPIGGSSVYGNGKISGVASDNIALEKIEVKINNGIWNTATGLKNWYIDVDFSELSNGQHTIYAKSIDTSGNSSQTESVIIIDSSLNNDITPPSVSVTYPFGNTSVYGKGKVSGSASDNVALFKIVVKIDDGEWHEAEGLENWYYDLDYSSLSNGDHQVYAKAIDSSGSESVSSTSFIVDSSLINDKTPPLISITYPIGGSELYGKGKVSGIASDNVTLSKIMIMIDNTGWRNASGLENWYYDMDYSTLSNGFHIVHAKAVDSSGNETQTSVSFVVDSSLNDDKIKPSISITYPIGGSSVYGNGKISGSAFDNVSLNRVQVKMNDGSWSNCTGTENWYYDLNYSSLPNGEYTIYAKAIDSSGNDSITSTTIIVDSSLNDDNISPTVSITYPIGGSSVYGNGKISGVASDNVSLNKLQVKIDSGSWLNAIGSNNWYYDINYSSLTNGSHLIYAKAIDSAGNETVTSTNIIVDSSLNNDVTKPFISITYPIGGSSVYGNGKISGVASDNVSLHQVQVRINNGIWGNGIGTENWYYDFNYSSLTDGSNILYAKAIDSSGNETITSTNIIVDSSLNNDVTKPFISITYPIGGSSVYGNGKISGVASDNVSLNRVEVKVDNGIWNSAIGTENWYYDIDYSSLTNGNHTLYAKAIDSSGNETITSSSIFVDSSLNNDTIKPSIAITYPIGGSSVYGSGKISGIASDNVSLSQIQVKFNNGIWNNAIGTDNWYYDINYASLSDGSHTIYAKAIDSAGNFYQTSTTIIVDSSINADTSNPMVFITYPVAGGSVKGNSRISGFAFDNIAVSKVEVKINSGSWLTAIGTDNWYYNFDFTTLSDGTHTVYARATDTSANTSQVSLQVLVDKAPPVVNAGSDIPWTKNLVTLTPTVTDSSPLSYAWTKVLGSGTVTFGSPFSKDTTVVGQTGVEESYTLLLTVTDSAGNIATDTVVFNWDSKAPVVYTGPDIPLCSTEKLLTPTVTDKSPLTYSWTQVSGTGSVTFGTPNQKDTTVVGPGSTSSAYTLRLTVTDSVGNTSSDTLEYNWSHIASSRLTALSLSACSFSPAFSSTVSSYKALVTDEISSITVSTTPFEPGASIKIKLNGHVVTNPITVDYGLNKLDIIVTSISDTNNSTTYSVEIGRGIEDNLALFEIEGIDPGPYNGIYIISGPGYEIERIPGYSDGKPFDTPGVAWALPFVFETVSNVYKNNLMSLQHDVDNEPDLGNISRRNAALIIKDNTLECGRFNLYEQLPDFYTDGFEGRTRFHFNTQPMQSDHSWVPYPGNLSFLDFWSVYAYPSGPNRFPSQLIYNPATDRYIEIEGVEHIWVKFDDDETNRLITIEFVFREGGRLYEWFVETVKVGWTKRNMSLVDLANPPSTTNEISRTHYYGVFPVKFQCLVGHGTYEKATYRMVISYDFKGF